MNAETRNFTRKPIRGRTIVVFPDGRRLGGSAHDLSLGGICIMVPEQMPAGLVCTTALETTLAGRTVHLVATAKVVYSILKGTEGFRTGLEFSELDAANNKTLAELMI